MTTGLFDNNLLFKPMGLDLLVQGNGDFEGFPGPAPGVTDAEVFF
jgi:hypothetical protein